MKKIDKLKGFTISLKFILVIVSMALFEGCTDKFESYNTNPIQVTDEQLKFDFNNVGLYYNGIQRAIFGSASEWQVRTNLSADCYSGYCQSANPFRGNLNNQNYLMVDSWNSSSWAAYNQIVGPVRNIRLKGTPTENPHFWAIALILQTQGMSVLTNNFGPIPYTQVGLNTATPYDSQSDIYNSFFAQLDTAVSNLQAYVAEYPGIKPFSKFDMVYAGDYEKWLRYANSLRLRLAMRIVNVDPATAKTQALLALNNPAGLIEVNSDNAAISGFGYVNPIWHVGTVFRDLHTGASLTTYLTGFNDPRLPKYCSPAGTNSPVPASIEGKYVGIRAGTPVGALPMYLGYTQPNWSQIQQFSPMMVMNAAEVWFLRAEAALRGWTTEDVPANYERGINASMDQWGVSIGDYLNDEESTQADYVDPYTPTEGVLNASIDAVSNITIKWEPTDHNERKLERIITQKWIALWPSGGHEAWAEYRRTGYPRLFPVVVNNSTSASTDRQIRRLPYPSSEYRNNNDEVRKAESLLGGPDNEGTPLWWDTNGGQANPVNF